MINVVCLVRVSATSAHGDGTGRRARRAEWRQLSKHLSFRCVQPRASDQQHTRTHARTTHARVEFRSRVNAAHKTERHGARDLRIASTFRSIWPLYT